MVVIAGVVVLTGAGVRADGTNTPPATLEEVVVTGTRTEKAEFALPYVADVIDAKAMQNVRLSRTVPEALRETPAVMVQKTSHGQGSPFIRGFTGFRTLFLIDGIRLNNSTFREGPNQYWSTVDPFSVERLEVVKGPGSVLYGSDAIGGMVNALTVSRSEYGAGVDWDGRAYYRYASAEDSHTGHGEVSGSVSNRFGFHLGGSYKDFGDLEGGSDTGTQPMTGYDEWDVDGKLEYFLNPNSKVVLAHQAVEQADVWRTHRTIFGKSFHGTVVGTDRQHIFDQDRDLTYLQYQGRELGSVVDAVTVSVSYQQQDERLARVGSDGKQEQSGVDVDTAGAWVQLETLSAVGLWTYGVEYYRDWVDSGSASVATNGTVTTAIQGPVADDATYDLAGVFVQDDMPLGERVELILGARYTYAHVEAQRVRDPVTGGVTSIEDDWDTVVGSGRVLYKADHADHWRLFAGVSQGFRAPNLSDLSRLDTARSGEIETAAPGLEPERYINYEIGVKGQSANWSGEIAYFYTDIEDMIVRAPTGNTVNGLLEVTKRNAGDGFVQGVELSGRYRFHPRFTAFGWVTWMEGDVDSFPTSAPVSQREPLSRLMPLTGEIGLRWDHPSGRGWVEAVCLMADKQDKLSTEDKRDTQRIPPGGTPGYAVVALRGGWQINHRALVSATVENITDADHRVHGSGVNEPGTNFVVGLDVRF